MKIEKVFVKVVSFLEKHRYPYLIIGGIAAGVLGEPRATGDIDIDIKIKKITINEFLKRLQEEGFAYDKIEVTKRIKETGTFKIWYGGVHIDFLISSTKFEESALERYKRIRLFGIEANFPSPEDMILFKVIPARPIDKIDITNIVICHKDKLDTKYLLDWAMRLSDEAQDIRIYEDVERLLE